MSWNINVTGNRTEVQAAVNTTVDLPDSVKGFVANATAYYTEETQLDFASTGHAHEGVIANCYISLKAALPTAEQLPADQPGHATQLPAEGNEATQLPADPPHVEHT
jgi:hypothetical protein